MEYILMSDEGKPCNINNDTIMIFLDETGIENLKDLKYPIYGFGGCIIPARLYTSNIIIPWEKLKDRHFGKKNKSMHATDLRSPTKEQLEALNHFFRTFQFGRFATVISDEAVIEVEEHLTHLIAGSTYKRIEHILSNTIFSNVLMIFEDSKRANRLMENFFGLYQMSKIIDGKNVDIEIERCFMSKSANEPGLEVADFIINAAGTTARDVLNKKIKIFGQRKDFENIFKSIDERISSFIYIKNVKYK